MIFPELPTTTAHDALCVSYTSSSAYEGVRLNVHTEAAACHPGKRVYLVRDMPFPSRTAAKAHALARGYVHPYSR